MGKKLDVRGWLGTIIIVLSAALGSQALAGVSEQTQSEIDYLLDYVAQANCVFIRNGKEYDAERAVKHMRKKYEHFQDEIVTVDDFIALAATKSLLSGKPYWVRLVDGTELKSADWLHAAVKDYRTTHSIQ
jgi:hypothetical protein